MEIPLSHLDTAKLHAMASRLNTSPRALLTSWIAEKLAHEPSPASLRPLESCACPDCPNPPISRGLCSNHYQKIQYYIKTRRLDEGWCIRHGRLLPPKGHTVGQYALEMETLDTLPHTPPNDRPDVRWLFGWPHAQRLRVELEQVPQEGKS